MKVRTRLVISFAYILLVVIVALSIPLGIVLRDRARSELEGLALTNALTIAALDADRVGDSPGIDERSPAMYVGTHTMSAAGSSCWTALERSSPIPIGRISGRTSRRRDGPR